MLPGGLLAGVASEPPLLKPRCLAAGFKGAMGIRAQGPLPAQGQEAWGTPRVSCPSGGCRLCSGLVLVWLVAEVAVARSAPSEISAGFKSA